MKDIASIIAIKTPANQSILKHHIRDLSLADAYNFGTIKDEIIKDRFVCGVRGSSLSKKKKTKQDKTTTSSTGTNTLEKCIDVCRSAGATSTLLIAICQH